MMQYIDPYYILTVIGIGYVVTQSDIAKPLRTTVSSLNQKNIYQPFKWFVDKFDGVVNCIYCASFWIGIGVYLTQYQDISPNTIFYPFAAMGAIYIIKNVK